jgi:CBS domain-containing protein
MDVGSPSSGAPQGQPKPARKEVTVVEVREIMTQPVYAIQQTASATEAAELMALHNIGALAVCDGDAVVGVITDRDLVIQCMASRRSPDAVQVHAIMTRDPMVVAPSTPVEEAARLMGVQGIHRVPVVQEGRAVGMLSADDVARFFNQDAVILEMERRLASYTGAPLPIIP